MRHSTEVGLMHGQESSTSGLDRMSSTQVLQRIQMSLLWHSCRLRIVPELHAVLPTLSLGSAQHVILKSAPGICIRQQICEHW